MFSRAIVRGVLAVATVCCAIVAQADTIMHGTTTINMDFVNIGNAGNAADDTTCGAVAYNYRIGTYEVTADQWAAVLAAAPAVGNAGNWSGSQPTSRTSWYEAAMFCNWLTTGDVNSGVYNTSTWSIMDHQTAGATFDTTYFIPTENEWYKAAYYDGTARVYYDYPTGSNTVPDGIDSNGDTAFDAVFYQGYNQGYPNSVTNAGVASPYGTIAQGGNVWEWNEAFTGSSAGLRGGSFYYGEDNLRASFRSTYFHPTTEAGRLGFRVASVPEPGSITLLVCGAVAGLMCWRRRKWHRLSFFPFTLYL